jgi:hypothetical protein
MSVIEINLKEFVKMIKPGDIIFSRSDTLFGKIIQFSGHCMWNHVAMCIIINNKKYWCESLNSSNGDDGVKIWEMEKGLRKCLTSNGDSFLFGLSKMNTTQKINTNLYKFYKKEEGKKYKKNYLTLFLSWFDGIGSLKSLFCCKPQDPDKERELKLNQPLWAMNKKDTSTYFCSELLVQALLDTTVMNPQFHKITKQEIPSSEWTVADLANTKYINRQLKKGYFYSEIVIYKVSN